MTASPDAPARRTRPRNRRAITLDAATKLFYRDGYARVSMSDIAAATNVGPSAIYRHFPGKADILAEAIRTGLAPYTRLLENFRSTNAADPDELASVFTQLAECALDHREIGVLYQRDSRNLDHRLQRELRDDLRSTTGLLASFIGAARPELDSVQTDALAWCCFGVLVSIGFHSLTLPRAEFVALMVDLIATVTFVPLSDIPDVVQPAAEIEPPSSRREQLITVATELFAERGFSAVGVDDIAEAVGIAGPSVYAHFPSKAAILAAAIDRAGQLLRVDTERVLSTDAPASVKLARLVDSYSAIANRDRYVPRTLISEMDVLPDADRGSAVRTQREYIDTWVELRRQFSPDSAVAARIRVQAVLIVVNDAVQTPHLRALPGFEGLLRRIADSLLGV
jgi:AcrR family transcriptional regulator